MSRVSFSTPVSRKPWLILLAMLIAWIGCICTAEAAEEPKVDVVEEESKCNPPLQRWNGADLVELRVSLETFAAQGLYIKVIDKERALGIVLIRRGCDTPWAAVKAFPLRIAQPKPKCEDSDNSKCL